MDPATPARLRAIVDRLLASTFLSPADRLFVEAAKEILVEEEKEILVDALRPAGTVTLRTCSNTMPEPSIVTLRMPEVE